MILRVLLILAALLIGGCRDDASQANRSSSSADASVSRSAIEQSLQAAETYFHGGDFPRAEAILLRLIERAPNEPAAHELHGQVLLARASDAREAGDDRASHELSRQAYERYRSALEHSPPSAGLHANAGDIAQMAGLDEAALEHYTQAMLLDPSQTRPAIMAAQILAQLERYDEAEDALLRSRRFDPDEPLIHASLANLALQQQQYEAAFEHIREARAIQPGELSYRVIEAMIHRKAGDPQRGLELLIGLPRQQRQHPTIANEIAACRDAMHAITDR